MIVVDAQVLWYSVHGGEFTPAATRAASRDARWVAPPLWRSELRNIVAGYLRRGDVTLEDALKAVERASALLSAEQLPETAVIIPLVTQSRCSAYDLEYVAVAQSLGIPLVTNDQQILRDFPSVAFSLESFAGGSA